MFMLKGINTSAMVYEPLSSIGYYAVTTPVNSVTKVYIEPKLKSFIEERNIPVFKEEKSFGFLQFQQNIIITQISSLIGL